jgi:hypothetical protein
MMYVVFELLLRRHIRHLQTFPINTVFPTMVRTAYAVLLDTPKKQRRQPVLTVRPNQARFSATRAKQDKVFPQ